MQLLTFWFCLESSSFSSRKGSVNVASEPGLALMVQDGPALREATLRDLVQSRPPVRPHKALSCPTSHPSIWTESGVWELAALC